ncbi:hypothetical protein [Deinococcus sonorensis]|uniref:Lipoprotein n=1 Tax=Deinococcus sonorensis TaxID=309891 RepID=A0ABV8YED9_9DEIO
MTTLRLVLLSGSLLFGLAACGEQACGTLPYCINTRPSEVQPIGGVLGGVTMTAGQTKEVTFTVARTDLPDNDPVYFVPVVLGPASSDVTLLGRSAEGIEVHGSQQPFTTETVQLTIITPPGLPSGNYNPYLKLRRVASRYASTSGPGGFYLTVP